MRSYIKAAFCGFVLLVSGCGGNDLSFVIRYDAINGLAERDEIIHEGEVIGHVVGYEPLVGDKVDVQVVIDQDVMPVITSSADFVITEHPTEPGRHVIDLISQDLDDPQVVSGQVLEGASEMAGMVSTFRRAVSEEWQNMFEQVEGLLDGLNENTIENEIAPLESEIDRLADDVNRLGQKAKRKLKEEILPSIQQKIEQLKSELETLGDDQSIERIEEKIDRLERTIEA